MISEINPATNNHSANRGVKFSYASALLRVFVYICAATLLVSGVLHLTWITQRDSQFIDTWLDAALEYRDRKTRLFRIAIFLLLIGLAMYVGAIAVMLLNPQPIR